MKVNKKIIIIAILLVSAAAVFSSCAKKTCPAYSSVQTTQLDQNG